MNSLAQAAEAVALAFTESACVQISTLALLIAKRIGRAQPDETIRLGDEGFNRLIHEIKIWISQLPVRCMEKIYKGGVWPHRFPLMRDEPEKQTFSIHVPGTPTGAEALSGAIYEVLCELGDLLARHGFDTHDIGSLYDRKTLPHLGVLLRFPWSSEMRTLFIAYGEDLDAIRALGVETAQEDAQALRKRATSMWDAV